MSQKQASMARLKTTSDSATATMMRKEKKNTTLAKDGNGFEVCD